jgi:acetyl-CoA carboxylase carboxyl transferase subunit beta
MTADVAPPLRHRVTGASELIATVLDPGSFRSWDTPPVLTDPPASPTYAAALAAARARSGVDEAVLTGQARIGGRPVAVACSEFGFLAG